jgi:hypothetical protein
MTPDVAQKLLDARRSEVDATTSPAARRCDLRMSRASGQLIRDCLYKEMM